MEPRWTGKHIALTRERETAMTDTLKGFTSMKNEQEGPRPPTGSLEEVRKWQAMHAGQAPTGSSQA